MRSRTELEVGKQLYESLEKLWLNLEIAKKKCREKNINFHTIFYLL